MPKLTFRGAFIRFVDLRYDEKSKTTFTKLNITAAFSEPVREAMEWGEPPAGLASGKLDGEMVASHFILTPDGKELKQHEMQMDARQIGDFNFARVKVGEDSHENELRFQIVTTVDGAAGQAEQYLRAIGKSGAQLRVNYEQQEALPLDDDKQDRLISEEQAHDTSEEADESPSGAPLAPAAVMGGTHQAKRPSRKAQGTVN